MSREILYVWTFSLEAMPRRWPTIFDKPPWQPSFHFIFIIPPGLYTQNLPLDCVLLAGKTDKASLPQTCLCHHNTHTDSFTNQPKIHQVLPREEIRLLSPTDILLGDSVNVACCYPASINLYISYAGSKKVKRCRFFWL